MYLGHFRKPMSITCISRVLAVVPERLARETLGLRWDVCFVCLVIEPHVTTQSPVLVLDSAITQFLDHASK
jgi:hypothetical protein